MPGHRGQTAFFSQLVKRAIRFLAFAVAITGLSVGFVWWVTEPEAGVRIGSASRRGTVSRDPSPKTGSRTPKSTEPHIPLYSEDWTDDSGLGIAMRYSRPITDPQSLEQVRTSDQGRGERGIARLSEELKSIDRRTPAGRAQALQLLVFIGELQMSVGEFAEADRFFDEAQKVDPDSPRLLRANLEALRGVAALRRGEADNCVACCNGSSCIFPLPPAGVHLRTSGSRQAIGHFTTYLEQRPEDLGVQWLVNVAYMTLGEYPDQVPAKYLIPLGPYQSDGGIGRFENIAGRVGLSARGPNMSGGSIVDDFTGDGKLDVFYSTRDATQGCALFVNKGDGTFEDCSVRAGLAVQVAALNCIHADIDNDGDLDVLLLRGGWETARRPSLLRNEGDGRFTDVTVAAGLCEPIASQAAGWADFDRDGDVDLYIAGEYRPTDRDARNRGSLYRNNGNGTFTDIAESAGVITTAGAKALPGATTTTTACPTCTSRTWGTAIVSTITTATARSPTSPNGWEWLSRAKLLLLVLGLRQRRTTGHLRHRLASDPLGGRPVPTRPAYWRRAATAVPQRGGPIYRRHDGGRLGPRVAAHGFKLRRHRQRRLPRFLSGHRQPTVFLPGAQRPFAQRGRPSIRGRDDCLGYRASSEGAWNLVRRLGPRWRR